LGRGGKSCIDNITCAEVDYLAACSDVTQYMHRCPFSGSLFHCLCHQFWFLCSSLKNYWFFSQRLCQS